MKTQHSHKQTSKQPWSKQTHPLLPPNWVLFPSHLNSFLSITPCIFSTGMDYIISVNFLGFLSRLHAIMDVSGTSLVVQWLRLRFQ